MRMATLFVASFLDKESEHTNTVDIFKILYFAEIPIKILEISEREHASASPKWRTLKM